MAIPGSTPEVKIQRLVQLVQKNLDELVKRADEGVSRLSTSPRSKKQQPKRPLNKLQGYVQPSEEELYYERVESVDTVRRDAAAAVLDAIHVARFLASRYFAPGVESVAADAHLLRSGLRS